jgi:hypothetical protein
MEEECSICTKNINQLNSCITACNHKYCLCCLIEHLKRNNNCPLCREKILDEPIIITSESSSESEDSSITDNQPEVIEIKSFEYYGKISLNNNLKHLIILLMALLQMNIVICVMTLSQ